MKLKKIAALLLILCFATSAFVGCGEKTPEIDSTSGTASQTEKPKDNVTLKFVFPGEVVADQDEVWGKLNEKSFADIGVGYSVEYIPWSDYSNKRNIYLQSGEEFDGTLLFAPELAFQWSKGAFAPLNDYISEEKSPNLLKVVDKQVFEDMSIGGEYTCFPSIVSYQNWYITYIIRSDWRIKYGMDPITTLTGLEEYFANIKKNEPGVIPIGGSSLMCLFREVGNMGFCGDSEDNGGPAAVDPKNPDMVFNWIESDHFKAIAEINKRWQDNGWLDKDCLSTTVERKIQSGKYGATTHDITVADTTKDSCPIEGAEFERVILNPEKPGFRNMWGNNLVAVPHTSKHPDLVVKWLDWLYSDVANYSLLLNGVEGKHHAIEGDVIKLPDGVKSEDSGYPIWYQWYWAQGKLDYYNEKFKQDTKDLIKEFNDMSTPVEISPTIGFTMNYDNIKNETTAISQAWTKYAKPILFGLVDYEKGKDQMFKAYKDAGIEKVIAEAQTQYDVWRKAK